jgi:hypothetical protein
MKERGLSHVVGFGATALPKEVLHHIFSYLDNPSLASACLASRSLRQIGTQIFKKRKTDLDMDPRKLEENTLPDLREIISPNAAVPAALATTIPEVLTLHTDRENVVTVPQNAQIVVPVLPECIPLIAKVPDVVSTEPENKGEPQEVKISQVLPGYPPSYASDYIPEQINSHSFNSFVNTISFNVSRYPTLSDVTDSKSYSKDSSSAKIGSDKVQSTFATKKFDYVPAEFFSGPESNFQTAGVRQAQSVSEIPPKVLGSGRILTQMTTLPTCTVRDSAQHEESEQRDLQENRETEK